MNIARIATGILLLLTGLGVIFGGCYFFTQVESWELRLSLIACALFGFALLISAWRVAKGESIWKTLRYLFTGWLE